MARFLSVPLALTALVLAGCGSSHGAQTQSTTTATATIPAAAAAPRCSSSALAVWLGLGEGGGTAGTVFYPLELTNISSRSCRLRGFPGVSAWNGHQLGSAARRDRADPVQTVTLANGGTAHALVGFTNVGNFSSSSCRPRTAAALKVFPPGERTSRFVPFSFRACSKPGPVFLSVRAVEPGVGVPGFSH
jgi:Domain of unknown function (DUF4232)